jgi:Ca2+-binding RTX toxin-like protein
MVGIENLTGSVYHDILRGDDGANWLRGLDGDDNMFGNGGDDVLDGGNGNDWLDGSAGVDTLTGGLGDDGYVVDNASDVIVESAGQGVDRLEAQASYALAPSVEIEAMSMYQPYIADAFDLTGNDFSQQITGNTGSNVLSGLGGNDVLSGGDGFDRLFGGAGNDLLFGGAGNDDLIGGSGADQFVYQAISESGLVPGAIDVIHDFNPAEGDKIDVSQMDSNDLVAGSQDWTFTGTTTFTAPGQVGFSSDGVDTFIFFNSDNDPVAESAIRVAGVHNVDASWFVL